jgi:hypothetical protein|nr:MAG TPA: hypothetical protein [Caudoviricetes sp.]
MKLWIDDVRPAPDGFIWAKTVKDAKVMIRCYERTFSDDIIVISLDHDAGSSRGGEDYIRILDWLEAEDIVDTGYFFHLHSMNPVGVENMRRIIQKNGWREIRNLEAI